MSLKKILILASMALAAMALAAPASALAEPSELFHLDTGESAQKNDSATFTGSTEFNTLGSGIECVEGSVQSVLTVSNSTTGIATFEVAEPTKCEGFGLFAGCVGATVETTSDPTVHTLTNDLELRDVTVAIKLHTDPECDYHGIETTFTTMTVGPTPKEDPETFTEHIHSATVTGTGFVDVWNHPSETGPPDFTFAVNGHFSLAIDAKNTETYALRAH